MIVLDKNFDNIDFSQGSGVTFGKFDGIHLGHTEIIKALNNMCAQQKCKSIVYSFNQNPANILNNANIKYIYTPDKKKQVLDELQVDYLYINDFDQYYAKTTPEEFIKMLIDKFNVKIIAVGYNSRFGACRKGGIHELEHLCKKYNIMLKIIPKVIYTKKDMVYDVSSTLIREAIKNGNIKLASELLGREYAG